MAFTVLFQGDSITDCGRSPNVVAGCSQSLGPGYPGLVAARLLCDHPEHNWNFINRGISGNRIVDLYARWKIDGINLAPNVISILIGVNDTWHEFSRQNGVEVPRFERIYRELLQWTCEQLPNVKFILMDPFLCPDVADRASFLPDVAARADVVARLAKEFNAVHIKTQELFNDAFKRAPQEFWAADGVHPTPAGHQLITDAWVKAATPILGL